MKIIRFFILLAIVFLVAWAYLQRNPDTWKEPSLPPALKSTFDQWLTWSKENAPQLQDEFKQLVQDMSDRAAENPELLQTAAESGAIGMIADATASPTQPNALTLEDLPNLDTIRSVVQKLKESKNFDLAARWESLAQNISRMAGDKQKEVTESE